MSRGGTGRRGFLKYLGLGLVGFLAGVGVGAAAFPRREVVERPVERVVEKPVVEERVVERPVPLTVSFGEDLTRKLWGDLGGRKHIVVIGAGPGGAAFVRELLGRFGERERPFVVTVVDRNAYWVSGPSHVEYVAGDARLEDMVVYTTALEVKGVVRVLNANVLFVDPDNRVVYTDVGRLSYDYLVLSPGIELASWLIEGLDRAPNLHIYKPSTTLAYRDAVERLERGTVLIYAPEPPYKCPPAPYEQANITASLVRKMGRDVRVVLLDAKPRPAPPFLAKTFLEWLERNGVEYVPGAKLAYVDPERREAVTEAGERFRYDVLSVLPPNTAPRFLWDSGLVKPRGRVVFVDSDPNNFRHGRYDDVYAIGDAALLPIPKSMYAAITEAQRLADYFARDVFGLDVGELREPHNVCWTYVSDELLAKAEIDYWYEDGVLRAQPKPGEPSAEYKQHRLAWTRGMMAQYWGREF